MDGEQVIPRALMDAYGAALDALEESTRARVAQAVALWLRERPRADLAELREYATSVAYAAAAEAAAQSEGVAGAVADAIVAGSAPERLTYEVDVAAVEGTVRRQINLVKGGKRGEFAEAVGELAAKHVKRAAREAAMGAHAKGVRYQRLQQGERTCTFCQMLASRGPVYYSEASAGKFRQFHAHCDCIVVEVPVGYRVEGFDRERELRKYSAFANIDADDARYPTREAKDAAKTAWHE